MDRSGCAESCREAIVPRFQRVQYIGDMRTGVISIALHTETGLQPADRTQPGRDGLPQQRVFPADEWFLLNGNPKIRRIATQRLAEEAGRCDADDVEGLALNI